MNINSIYITAKDKEEARKIGRILVSERLAACVNILDGMNSMYWWDGKVQDDNEAVLIAKTRESLVSALIEKVKSVHSYSCPCVVSMPVVGGNIDYLRWVEKETEKS
jgi:periplasmic divalent cation tolerance protein